MIDDPSDESHDPLQQRNRLCVGRWERVCSVARIRLHQRLLHLPSTIRGTPGLPPCMTREDDDPPNRSVRLAISIAAGGGGGLNAHRGNQ